MAQRSSSTRTGKARARTRTVSEAATEQPARTTPTTTRRTPDGGGGDAQGRSRDDPNFGLSEAEAREREFQRNPQPFDRLRAGVDDFLKASGLVPETGGGAASRVPGALNLGAASTGITSGAPGSRGSSVRDLGQGVVDASALAARGQFGSETEDADRRRSAEDDITAQRDETTAEIDALRGGLKEEEDRIQGELALARDALDAIPREVDKKFNEIRTQFGAEAAASLGRLEGRADDALSKVFEGESRAMDAAVQGIQGNVNTQVANIQADPNLTAAQKSSMIAQVKLSGASAMGPAIGATQLAFNQLASSTAQGFGQILGNLEGQVLSTSGQLGATQAATFASTQIAMQEISGQLLTIDANSTAAFANSQSQLLGVRSQAQLASNDLLLRSAAEFGTPWLDLTGSATNAYAIGSDLITRQYEIDLADFNLREITIPLAQSQQGTPLENIINGLLGGFQAGGGVGAVFGGVGAIAGEQGPRI